MKTLALWVLLASGILSTHPILLAEAPAAEAKIAAVDSFAVGRVWTGKRHFEGGKAQLWRLHVETREGEKFTGYIVLGTASGNPVRVAVEGSAPADGAGFVGFSTTEAKGDLRQRFSGTLKNNFVDLSFKGRNLSGEDVSGTADLSPKK